MSLPDLWMQSAVVLFFAIAAIVGIATLVAALVRSGAWQKTLWQAATLSLLAILACEFCGMSRAVVAISSALLKSTDESTILGKLAQAKTSFSSSFAVQHVGRTMDDDPLTDHYAAVYANRYAIENSLGVSDPDSYAELYAEGYLQATMGGFVTEAEAGDDTDAYSEEDFAADEELILHEELSQSQVVGASLLGATWLFGCVCVLAKLVFSHLQLAAIRRKFDIESDAKIPEAVARLAPRLGIRKSVCVRRSPRAESPAAFGILRPVIVLPERFESRFGPAEQEAMLAHELEHLAARDPLWQFVSGFTCALLWWHPLAWWTREQLCESGERAADEASMLLPDGPGTLAACLVSCGRRLGRRQPMGWLSIEGGPFRSALGQRVERLLELSSRPWRAPGRGRLFAARTVLPVAMVVLAISCTAWAQVQAPRIQGESTMGVFSTSWRCSLAAAALWAVMGSDSGNAIAADAKAPAPETKCAAADKSAACEKQCEKQCGQKPCAMKHGKHHGQKGKHGQKDGCKGCRKGGAQHGMWHGQKGKHGCKSGCHKGGAKHGMWHGQKGKHGCKSGCHKGGAKHGMWHGQKGKHGCKNGCHKGGAKHGMWHGQKGKHGHKDGFKSGCHKGKHGHKGNGKHGCQGQCGKHGSKRCHGQRHGMQRGPMMGFHGPRPPFAGPMGFHGPMPEGRPMPPFAGPGPMGFHGPRPEGRPMPPFAGPGPMGFHGPRPEGRQMPPHAGKPRPGVMPVAMPMQHGPEVKPYEAGPKAEKPAQGPQGPGRPDPEQMKKRMEEVKKKIEQLRAEGKTEEAKQLEERVQRYAEGKRPSPEEIKKHIEEAKKKLEQLRSEGKTEEAKQLEERMKRHGERKQPSPEEIKKHLEEAKKRLEQLRSEGKAEEAKKMEERIKWIESHQPK